MLEIIVELKEIITVLCSVAIAFFAYKQSLVIAANRLKKEQEKFKAHLNKTQALAKIAVAETEQAVKNGSIIKLKNKKKFNETRAEHARLKLNSLVAADKKLAKSTLVDNENLLDSMIETAVWELNERAKNGKTEK